jgi:hypothetical protein
VPFLVRKGAAIFYFVLFIDPGATVAFSCLRKDAKKGGRKPVDLFYPSKKKGGKREEERERRRGKVSFTG